MNSVLRTSVRATRLFQVVKPSHSSSLSHGCQLGYRLESSTNNDKACLCGSAQRRYFTGTTRRLGAVRDMYDKVVAENEAASVDEHQLAVVDKLDNLLTKLEESGTSAYSNPQIPGVLADATDSLSPVAFVFGFFKSASERECKASKHSSRRSLPKGLYIHGGVGCGKTFTMNLFHSCVVDSPALGAETVQKVHFHQFMLDVHQSMHNIKRDQDRGIGNKGDPLPQVMREIAGKGRVICFDEFQVTDVADALILRRLFTGLHDLGCVFVSTSNRPPEDLYLNGLQRDLFLPFIDALKENNEVVSMWGSDVDYRLVHGKLMAKGVYFLTSNKGDGERYGQVWDSVVSGSPIKSVTLRTQGRDVFVPECVDEKGIARFNFWDLCGKSKGAADYLEISKNFDTIFLYGVPTLEIKDMNVVRRFITLVDALYENSCKIVVLADAMPNELFVVDLENKNHDEVFAFDRTRSRLDEMMSKEWLKKKARA